MAHVQLVSMSKNGQKAEIIISTEKGRQTLHVVREGNSDVYVHQPVDYVTRQRIPGIKPREFDLYGLTPTNQTARLHDFVPNKERIGSKTGTKSSSGDGEGGKKGGRGGQGKNQGGGRKGRQS